MDRATGWAGGSSPRGRGKPTGVDCDVVGRGLIPARAGKTPGQLGTGIVGAAHPRAGGENQDENIVNLSKQGSSPRGRGKQAVEA